MTTEKANKNNGNLSLKPLKFEEAVEAVLKVKPEPKNGKQDNVSTKTIKKKRQEKYIAWSSLEGTLDVISVHARPFFAIYEHGTKNRVRCTFPDDWIQKIIGLLGKRVLVEGLVYYKQSGEPYQLTKPTFIDVVPAPNSDLLALRGSIPGMTGNLSTYEYMHTLRQKSECD